MTQACSRSIAATVSAVAITMMSGLVSAEPGTLISGRYCGLASSNDMLVDVVTVLEEQPDGLLRGTYEFTDYGQVAAGTLQEFWKLSDLRRTLIWSDKYGIGQVTMQFESSGDSFKGLWGLEANITDLRWDGERCDEIALGPDAHSAW